jgi:hypothetical protein
MLFSCEQFIAAFAPDCLLDQYILTGDDHVAHRHSAFGMCGGSSRAFLLEHFARICAREWTRDPCWAAEHIERVPPEIRDAFACLYGSSPPAGHYFATGFDQSHVIKPHFEHCDGREVFAPQRTAPVRRLRQADQKLA